MAATGWSATVLFELPKYLGRDGTQRLADLYFAYQRACDDTRWRMVFGEFARALEADIAAVARGLRANPRARYRSMGDAELRQHIWETRIKCYLPADFIVEFAWLGPPTPEEVARLSEPGFDTALEVYFREVNAIIRGAKVARDVAARWTREVVRAQGFDVHPEQARVFDDLVTKEETLARQEDE